MYRRHLGSNVFVNIWPGLDPRDWWAGPAAFLGWVGSLGNALAGWQMAMRDARAGGAALVSPALQRGVCWKRAVESHRDDANGATGTSAVPSGLEGLLLALFPTLKRGANIHCASGARSCWSDLLGEMHDRKALLNYVDRDLVGFPPISQRT